MYLTTMYAAVHARPPHRCRTKHMCAGLLLGLALFGTAALAGPPSGQVVAGQGSISQPNSNTTLINQQSNRLIIDWSSFNLATNQTVQFNQPSVSAAALNRILSQNPSQIFGNIIANGQVYLLNPNGIVFGKTAMVNVGGLFATGLNISNSDFMNGNLKFAAPNGQNGGYIINHGVLQAAYGGSINLIGSSVFNDGIIIANLGQVNLAAGSAVTVDFNGDGLMQFQVTGAVLHKMVDAQSGAAVTNAGKVEADGGTVVMTAAVAEQVLMQAVDNVGLVQANGIQNKSGHIYLSGGGDVINNGLLDASNTSGNGGTVVMQSSSASELIGNGSINVSSVSGQGGSAEILGNQVGMFDHATVNAEGASGGGTILVGGDAHGAGSVQTASATVIAPDVVLNADATGVGNGGKVVVWSNDYTNFAGYIDAQGGLSGGNGGWVETSSLGNLQAFGLVNASAPQGSSGTWLLDPADISICSGCTTSGTFSSGSPDVYNPGASPSNLLNTDLDTALQGNTNVVVFTHSGTGGTGNITINAPIAPNLSATTTLTLQADNSVLITNAGSIAPSGNALNLNLWANDVSATPGTYTAGACVGCGITLNGSIITNGGNFIAVGPTFANSGNGTISTAGAIGGAIDLSGVTGSISLGASLTTQGGIINLGNSPVSLTNSLAVDTTDASTASAGANVSFGGTLDGAYGLTVNAGSNGTLTFSSAVGASTPLSSLHSNSGTLSVASTLNIGSGGLDLTTTAGPINQSSAFTVIGASVFNAGSNAITLTNGGNSFSGAVTLNTSGANNAALIAGGALQLAGSSVGGSLNVSAGGDITESGALNVSGPSNFTITGAAYNILLDTQANNFNGQSVTANVSGSGSITTFTLEDTSTLALFPTLNAVPTNLMLDYTQAGITVASPLTLAGYFDLTAGRGITLSGSVSTGGTQTYNGPVALAGNTTLTGTTVTLSAVTGTGNNLTVTGNAALNGVLTTVNNLSVSGTSAINTSLINTSGTQTYTGAVTLGTATTLQTGGGAGANISFGSIVAGGANNSTFNVGAGGSLAQSGAFTDSGTVTLTGGAITLTNPGNDFGTVVINNGAIVGSNVQLSDKNSLILGNVSLNGGTVSVSAATGLTLAGVLADASSGSATLTLNVDTGGTGASANFSGATVSGFGASKIAVNGNTSAGDTLVGLDTNQTWNITGMNAGNLDGGVIAFTRITNLTGGGGNNSFDFQPGVLLSPPGSVTGNINGGSGSNTLNYGALAGPIGVTLTSNTGGTASNIGGAFSNINKLIGSASNNDTLSKTSGTNTWTINGANTGNVNGFAFSSIENLNGGSGNDTFNFNAGSSLSGALNGGGGSTNTLNLSGLAGDIVTLTTLGSPGFNGTVGNIGGGFSNINNFVGSAGGTLVGSSIGAASWTLGATSQYNNTNTVSLSGFGTLTAGSDGDTFDINTNQAVNLTGGSGNDDFVFANGATITGNINGGGGTDNTLNYSAYTTPVSVNLTTGKATGVSGTISNIESVIGGMSGANSLAAGGSGNNWIVSGLNSGTLDGALFQNIQSITGGTNDSFTFSGGGALAGSLNGGSGNVTLAESSGGLFTVNQGVNFGGTSGVTLSTPIAIDSSAGNGAINFGNTTVNGASAGGESLTLNAASGAVTLSGTVGTTPLASLTASGGSMALGTVNTTGNQNYIGATTLNGNLTSSAGTLTFNSAVQLNADVSLTGNTVTFVNALNGAHNLAVAGNGVFNGVNLSSLSVSGSTTLASTVTTTGTQTYNGAVTLDTNVTLAATNSAVTFDSTVDSAGITPYALNVNAGSGAVIFDRAVGSLNMLSSLQSAGSGAVTLNGNVSTTGNQTYNGAVTLGTANTVLTANSVSFNSALDGNSNLTVSGNSIFNGQVGNGTALAGLAISGATTLNGDLVKTTGNQNYAGAVTLGANANLIGSTITFADTLDGAHNLVVTGNSVLDNNVGSSNPLASLTVTGTTLLNTAAVSTSGTQAYGGAVTLGADADLTGTTVTFTDTLDGAHNLVVTGDGVFGNNVGVGSPLTSLTVTGTSLLDTAAVTTAGNQIYGGATILGTDSILTGSTITFAGKLDGAHNMTMNGGGVFDGVVGSGAPLASLTMNGTTTINASALSTVGSQTYNGTVTFGASATLTTGGGAGDNIAFGSTAAGGVNNLTLNVGASGNLTQVGVFTDSGIVTLTGGAIALTNPGNDFGTVVINNSGIAGSNVALTDQNSLILGAVSLDGGSATLDTGLGVTLTGALTDTSGNSSAALTLNVGTGGTGVDTDFSGATVSGFGLGKIVVNGNSGASDTLIGLNGNQTWNITGANAGNLDSGVIAFSNIADLIGSSGNDDFILAGGSIASINGGAGSNTLTGDNNGDTFTINAANSGVVSSSAGTLVGAFSNIQNLVGGSGNNAFVLTGGSIGNINGGVGGSNTLVGDNGANTWTITASNQGAVTGVTAFTNIQNLTGGTGNDDFIFSNGATVSGTVDGGAGGNNILDFSAYTTPISVTLGGSNGFGYSGSTAGSPNPTGGFAEITQIDEPALANILNLANGTPTTVIINSSAPINLFSLTVQMSGSPNLLFSHISTVNGGSGAVNTLESGEATNNTWTLTAANSGTYNDGQSLGFSNFANLVGGSGNDAFILAGGSITSINGGAGDNTLTGDNNGDTFTIATANGGNVTSSAGTLVGAFSSIQNLIGGSGDDSFVLAGGNLASINGGGGNNTLTGDNSGDTFTISATNAGSVSSSTGTLAGSFDNIQNLNGGTGNDSFVFTPAGVLTGNLTGGGGTDILDYSNLSSPVSATLTAAGGGIGSGTATAIGGTFSGISILHGGTSANNLLTGPNQANTWTISGANAGNVDGFLFSNIGNLNGGNSTNAFVLAGGNLSGNINGGGGVAAGNSLQGNNVTNTWNITGANQGRVTDIAGAFSNIGTLIGGSGTDDFIFANNASLSGSLNGGGVTSGDDQIDWSAYTTARNVIITGPGSVDGVQGTEASIAGGFDNITTIVGANGAPGLLNGLTGPNGINTWDVTAANAGTLNGALSYSNFQTLTGGSSADTFNLAAGVSGSINGGGGSDTVNVISSFTAPAPTLSINNIGTIADNTGAIVTAQTLAISGANSIGTAADPLLANLVALQIANSGGSAFISTIGSVDLQGINLGGGSLTLASSSAITDNSGQNITAGTLNLTAVSSMGTTAAPLQTAAANLSAAISSVGDIHVNNTGALTLSAAGTANGSINLISSAALTLNGPVTAGGNGAVNLATGNGDLTAASTIATNGSGNVTLHAAGNLNLDNSISSGDGNLVLTGGTGVIGNAGGILAGNAIDVTASGGNITFSGVTTGAPNGTVLTASGGITLQGFTTTRGALTVQNGGSFAVTGPAILNDGLAQTGAGGVTLASSIAASAGNVQFASPVTVSNSSITTAGGEIVFAQNITGNSGASALALNSGAGAIKLQTVGGLGSLSLQTGGLLSLGNNVAVNNLLTSGVTGQVMIAGANVTISTANSEVDFSPAAGINGLTTGGQSLTISSGSGSVILPAVGMTMPLASLAIDGSTITLANVATHGAQSYSGDVQLDGTLTSLAGGGVSVNGNLALLADDSLNSGGGNISIGGTVDGAHALTLTTPSGQVLLGGAVGGNTALTSLTLDSAGASLGSVTTFGTQSYQSSDTRLAGVLTSQTGAINFSGVLNVASASAIQANSIGFDGGSGSVRGSDSLTLVPETKGLDVNVGGSGSGLTLNNTAMNGYDGALYIGTGPGPGGALIIGVPIAAGDVALNGSLTLGSSGSLLLAGMGNLSLNSGTITADTVTLIAGSQNSVIQNPGTLKTLISANTVILVSGGQIGNLGQEVNIQTRSKNGQVQIATGAIQSFLLPPNLPVVIGPTAVIADDIAAQLGLFIQANSQVTSIGQQIAALVQTGGLLGGFIDVSLFQNISLYDVYGQGITLPVDQCEQPNSTLCNP